jgi:hypothetical protein
MDKNIATPDEISAGVPGWYRSAVPNSKRTRPRSLAATPFLQRLVGQFDVTLHWINAEDMKGEARGEFQRVLPFSTAKVND